MSKRFTMRDVDLAVCREYTEKWGDCLVVAAEPAWLAQEINRLVKGADVPPELVGPAVTCRGETTITHPEHGNRTLPAGTVWATVYQRQFAEEVRRVED